MKDQLHAGDFACMPIKDDAGRMVVVVPTGMDITERVHAEQNQRALEAERRRAEAPGEIDRAKTQFFANVSHEFRTPLNLILASRKTNNLLQVVLGNLDGLKRRIDGSVAPSRSEIVRAVEGAMRGAERAANLTQQLLAFSRRQPLEPRAIDVNRLVTRMSELLRRTLGESIEIQTVQSGGLWRIYADPNQLENAIINLAVILRRQPDEDRRRGLGAADLRRAHFRPNDDLARWDRGGAAKADSGGNDAAPLSDLVAPTQDRTGAWHWNLSLAHERTGSADRCSAS